MTKIAPKTPNLNRSTAAPTAKTTQTAKTAQTAKKGGMLSTIASQFERSSGQQKTLPRSSWTRQETMMDLVQHARRSMSRMYGGNNARLSHLLNRLQTPGRINPSGQSPKPVVALKYGAPALMPNTPGQQGPSGLPNKPVAALKYGAPTLLPQRPGIRPGASGPGRPTHMPPQRPTTPTVALKYGAPTLQPGPQKPGGGGFPNFPSPQQPTTPTVALKYGAPTLQPGPQKPGGGGFPNFPMPDKPVVALKYGAPISFDQKPNKAQQGGFNIPDFLK